MTIQRMSDLDLAGKRVLIRQDLNVPVEHAAGQPGTVTSDLRITASLPTLRAPLDADAAVMVMSHLGRPQEGEWREAASLAPVAARLSDLLGRAVPLVRAYPGCVPVAPGPLFMLANYRMQLVDKDTNAGMAKHNQPLSAV